MAPNEHLLDNFSASKETRSYGAQILRLAQAKSGPGSGRELRELRVGLPAVAILIACERLNNTDVNKKAAQAASCLKASEFKKVYETVCAILDENKRTKEVTYENLHGYYKSGILFDSLREFLAEIEPDTILQCGHGPESSLTRCATYFWVLNCLKPSALPDRETFAQNHDLSVKKFTSSLEGLNEHCKPLRKKIVARFKASASQDTPRRSRSSLGGSEKGSPSQIAAERCNEGTPIRRSSRLTGTSSSPIKSPLPPPWKKGPIRELPSKDTPKKRNAANNPQDESMHTPFKRQKITRSTGSLSIGAFLDAVGESRSQKSPLHSPTRSPTKVTVSSPLKRNHTVASLTDVSSDSDESGSDIVRQRGRFRPVYHEQRQWTVQDPLVATIWRRVEKARGESGHRRNKSYSRD